MKISTINIALAFIFAVAFSACTQEDSPLNDNSLAAYELSMEELKNNTTYLQVQLAEASAEQCATVFVNSQDEISGFLPGEKAEEVRGIIVAEVTFSNERDQQKTATLEMVNSNQLILDFAGERVAPSLSEDQFNHAISANCEKVIAEPTASSSNSNMAEAAPEEGPKPAEKSTDLSSANHTQQN